MPSCKQFEPPGRWHVTSDGDPDRTHLVDVLAWGGFGECSCEHYEYRILPALKNGTNLVGRCKHIEAAREAFTDLIIESLNKPRT